MPYSSRKRIEPLEYLELSFVHNLLDSQVFRLIVIEELVVGKVASLGQVWNRFVYSRTGCLQ